MALPGDGKNLVTYRLFYSILVHENKRIVGEERFVGETRGDYRVFPHEFQSEWMRAEKLFDRPRMRLGGVSRHDGFLKRQELFAVADHETIVRDRDNIGYLAA